MRISRIYFSAADAKIKVDTKIYLNDETSKYLLTVLRLRIGDYVCIFSDLDLHIKSGEFLAKLVAVENRRRAVLFIESFIPKNIESPLKIHLGQGISRGEKMDYTIQKAVELGVNSITPLFTKHCNVFLDGERLEKKTNHWQKIAIHASEQSGRCYVPKVNFPQEISSWVISVSNGEIEMPQNNILEKAKKHNKIKVVLEPRADFSLKTIAEKIDELALLIGPEGGFCAEELNFAVANGFQKISLGPRVLRTETAAVAALSVLQGVFGDMA